MEIEIGLKPINNGLEYAIVEIEDLRPEGMPKVPVKAQEKIKVKLQNMVTLTHPPFRGAKESARPGGELVLPATFKGKPITRIDNETNKETIGDVRLLVGNEYHEKTGKFGLTKITIPEGITVIGNSAFNNFEDTQFFSIPESVKSIESAAFACHFGTLPRAIAIANGVETIGMCAFSNNNGLIEIIIPESVTFIDEGAFQSCNSLTEIVIPESVTSIGNDAFKWCSNLEKVTLPLNIKLGRDIFKESNSKNLKITTDGKTEKINEWEKRIKEAKKKSKQIIKEVESVKMTASAPVPKILKFKKEDDRFIATVDWFNQEVYIYYDDEDDKKINQAAKVVAQKLFDERAEWDKEAKEVLVDDFYDEYNAWHENEDDKISKEEFLKRMYLSNIFIKSDGDFEFWYVGSEEDKLLGDHRLILAGNIEDGFEGGTEMFG
jgi:hypothetical protein